MTHDDSVPIGATSLAPRRALAHMRRAERACGRDAMRDVVASGHGRAPVGRKKGSVARQGNFPPCKALKTHKTGKESRFCASTFHGPAERPAPRRTAQRAGGAARQNGVAGKWRRNGLKRLNPGPEMVGARKPRTHKIWYTGAVTATAGGAAGMTKLRSCRVAEKGA